MQHTLPLISLVLKHVYKVEICLEQYYIEKLVHASEYVGAVMSRQPQQGHCIMWDRIQQAQQEEERHKS